MKNNYIPQVGDRVRRPDWKDGDAITVTAVGEQELLGKLHSELAYRYGKDYPWVKVEPPPTYPEAWINVYPHVVASSNHSTRVAADNWALDHNTDDVPGYARIAVIHLAADGTLTLYPTTGGAS